MRTPLLALVASLCFAPAAFADDAPQTPPPAAAEPVKTEAPPATQAPAAAEPEPEHEKWAPVAQVTLPAYDAARARELYEASCRICHGSDGKGDGAAARYLQPPPRDFTRGLYKFRSTPSGAPPTHQDLYDTLTRGLAGTAMPSWLGLTPDERWQLVQYVEAFSPRFKTEPATEALVVPPAPELTHERVVKGREVWLRMQCSTCHGEDARGWGPAAKTSVDDQGRPSYPFNLTRRQNYRVGRAPEDLFRTLFTGLDGTAMPSYSGAVTPDDAWSLVAYVRSLSFDQSVP